MKNHITLLLVDDHPLVREGIRASLSSEPSIRVVGEASDGLEAIRKAKTMSPNVVLMDISMPKMTGIEATRRLLQSCPKCRVLILSMHKDDEYIKEIVRAGAKGYVLKDAPPQELVKAIIAVNSGQTYFSPVVSQKLLTTIVEKKGKISKAEGSELTEREEQVLIYIADGLSSKEIAQRLGVSARTVETHREHIMSKLNIHTVAGLTKYAISKGFSSY